MTKRQGKSGAIDFTLVYEDELWKIWKYSGGCGATGGQVGLSLLDKQIGFG